MKWYFFPLVLLGGCLILYGRSIGFTFVSFDDPWHISTNPYFHPVTLNSFKELWTQPYAHLYIPVTYSVWALTSLISQTSVGSVHPGFFHALNVLTHTLNVILVYFLIHNLLKSDKAPTKKQNQNENRDKWAAFLGTCLFAFHPMQSGAIAWVSGFKDLIVTTLSLSAFYFYLKPRKLTWISSFGFYLAALLAKPSAVVLAGNAWLLERTQPEKTRRPWWSLIFWLIAAGIIILLTQNAQQLQSHGTVPFLHRPFIALDSLGFYCRELFWPVGLSGDHGRTPARVWEEAPTWLMFLPIIIAAIMGIFVRALPKHFLKGIAFFLVALVPVSGFIQFGFQIISSVADYYVYFPMIGLAWSLAILVQAQYKRSTLIVVGSIMAILFVWSCANLSLWKNSELFNVGTLQENPRSDIALEGLAGVEEDRGNLPKALEYLQKVVEHKQNIELLSELATLLNRLNRLNEAEERLKNAFPYILKYKDHFLNSQLERSSATNVGFLLAKIYISHGDLQNAIEPLALAVECSPNNAEIHYQFGKLLENTGNTAQAHAEFLRACTLEPANTNYSTHCH